ncbi:MAG: hypothetical protein M3380_18085 [Chloroflexota bacterium]|nr:hypothetical protein [Chloroflexota bacterium]
MPSSTALLAVALIPGTGEVTLAGSDLKRHVLDLPDLYADSVAWPSIRAMPATTTPRSSSTGWAPACCAPAGYRVVPAG